LRQNIELSTFIDAISCLPLTHLPIAYALVGKNATKWLRKRTDFLQLSAPKRSYAPQKESQKLW